MVTEVYCFSWVLRQNTSCLWQSQFFRFLITFSDKLYELIIDCHYIVRRFIFEIWVCKIETKPWCDIIDILFMVINLIPFLLISLLILLVILTSLISLIIYFKRKKQKELGSLLMVKNILLTLTICEFFITVLVCFL